jgi:hypothetical protein
VPQAALKQPEEKPAPKVIEKQLDEKMPKGWMSFSPAGGRFALFLPGEPKESKTVSQTVRGPIENHTFTIEAGRNSYAVAWFDFKGVVPQGPQIKGALDGGQKGMLDRMGDINILKQDDIDLNGFPGREVVFDSADKKSTLTVRLYLVKQRCYTLIATAPQGKSDQPEVRQFFDSFRLTP